jgi:hypothetical protein
MLDPPKKDLLRCTDYEHILVRHTPYRTPMKGALTD